jgi:hypothetical protein
MWGRVQHETWALILFNCRDVRAGNKSHASPVRLTRPSNRNARNQGRVNRGRTRGPRGGGNDRTNSANPRGNEITLFSAIQGGGAVERPEGAEGEGANVVESNGNAPEGKSYRGRRLKDRAGIYLQIFVSPRFRSRARATRRDEECER